MPVVVFKLYIIFPLQFSKKLIENLFSLFFDSACLHDI
jgi:hypothetical protein